MEDSFLVLREMIVSERILASKSLLKRNILFWNEDIGKDLIKCKSAFKAFENEIDLFVTEIQAATLDPESEEVGATIAGYITKKLAKWSKSSACKMFLATNSEIECQYFQLLSRGGLTVPSETLAQFVCSGFALLDVTRHYPQKHLNLPKSSRNGFAEVLMLCVDFVCEVHLNWGVQLVIRLL